MLSRRSFMAALASVSAAPAFAQHAGHDPVYSHLTDPKDQDCADRNHAGAAGVRFAGAEGGQPGQMGCTRFFAIAAQRDGLGDRARQQDACRRRLWRAARRPALSSCLRPGVRQMAERAAIAARRQPRRRRASLGGKLYAIGGFVEQNRKPRQSLLSCSRARPGAPSRRCRKPRPPSPASNSMALIHAIGGAVGDTFADKKSVDWHLVYDPRTTMGDARADADRARPYRHARRERPHPRDRRARRQLPHQFQPASRLRSGQDRQMGAARAAADRALGPRRGALSRQDLRHGRRRQPTACSARTKPTIRRKIAGNPTRR